MIVNSQLAHTLKTLMSHHNINPAELARQTGIAQPIIYRLMTGQNINPKLATIQPIAQYFATTLDKLIGSEPFFCLRETQWEALITQVC